MGIYQTWYHSSVPLGIITLELNYLAVETSLLTTDSTCFRKMTKIKIQKKILSYKKTND